MSWTSALWARLQSLGFFVFVLIVGVGVALLFVPLLHQRHAMQLDIAQLDHAIEQQEALENKQQTEVEALRADPGYVERTARNKLNLSRPNEMIFRFEPVPQRQNSQH
jgi:cell division protein DivIC